MEFEWDKNKDRLNKEKHGVSFEEAIQVFEDEKRLTKPDLRKDYGEPRWKTVGQVLDSFFSVVYTVRSAVVRLISARLASRKEREDYLGQ